MGSMWERKIACSALPEILKLKPSKEVLQFLHRRVLDLDSDLKRVDEETRRCRNVLDRNGELQTEVRQKEKELQHWMKCIKELENALVQQKETLISCQAENNKLKICRMLQEKKLNYLMSRHNVTNIPVDNLISVENQNSCLGVFQNPETALQYAESLSHQIETLTQFYHDQLDAMLSNCKLIQREKQLEMARLKKRNSELQQRLGKCEAELLEATEKSLKEVHNRFTNFLANTNRAADPSISRSVMSGYGSQSPTSAVKTNQLQKQVTDQDKTIKNMKVRLQQKDEVIVIYETQCQAMQEQSAAIQQELDITKTAVIVAKSKMSETVKLFRKQLSEIERRRKVEAEGYMNDVKQLRLRLKSLEKQFADKLSLN